jgi:hypothetical protein
LDVAATEKPEREEAAAKSSARVASPMLFRQLAARAGGLLLQYIREVLIEEHLRAYFGRPHPWQAAPRARKHLATLPKYVLSQVG